MKPLARLCAVTVAAGLAAGFAAPAASSADPIATPPANCASMSSPYDYTQQAASKCYTTDPLVSVSALPDGGLSYNYLQNGQVVSEPVPPAGFDILTASAGELERYGLPARPASEPDLSEWQNEFRNARFATPPPFLAEVPPSLATPPPPPSSGVSPLYTNARFAGYETDAGSFTAGSALYTEPGLQGVSCSSPAIAIWSGIGSSTSIFGQDGTISYPDDNHHTFWQVWNANSNTYRASGYMFTAAANEQIRANVNYSNGTFGGTVTDVSANPPIVNGWSYGGFSGTPNSAEAIVEQLEGYDMANFGSVPFSYSQGNGQPIPNFGDEPLNNSPNATVGGINGNGGFTVTFHHC